MGGTESKFQNQPKSNRFRAFERTGSSGVKRGLGERDVSPKKNWGLKGSGRKNLGDSGKRAKKWLKNWKKGVKSAEKRSRSEKKKIEDARLYNQRDTKRVRMVQFEKSLEFSGLVLNLVQDANNSTRFNRISNFISSKSEDSGARSENQEEITIFK